MQCVVNMEKLVFVWLSVICFTGFVLSDDHGDNSVSYNKESFDAAIAKDEILFVMFYAPW